MKNWKPVVGYEGLYRVSECGCVESVNRTVVDTSGRSRFLSGRSLKPFKNKNGYMMVDLGAKNGPRMHRVHVLVAAAFIGPRPNGMDVCHADGSRDNNSASNLRYASRSENMIDAVGHGRMGKALGSSHASAKLSPKEVLEIRSSDDSERKIAKKYNVSRGTITAVKSGRTWSHVIGEAA